ncbi:MAG TPA: phosphoadenylyl-sulfate reductase [Chitinispirillaceae bacterium]|nr:phosphoadenylyl-sulfate reductase [Chitinispirillaceae bacterium]
MNNLEKFNIEVCNLDAAGIISWALKTFGEKRIALASSFSAEDQVLTNLLLHENPHTRIFTLDTGRHFQETYDVWQKSVEFWNFSFETASADPVELSKLLDNGGPNLFYKNIESRKACCSVRKTNPLKKILSTVDAWIVGLRSEQAVTRTGLSPVEWDQQHNIYRISPLYNWIEIDVFRYSKENALPLSELYLKGFRSIGCAPCSRSVAPFDDIRAGRWWWEEPQHKECGLHNRPKPSPQST